ncbi:MAG: ImuA family protein [Bauldia sp.]
MPKADLTALRRDIATIEGRSSVLEGDGLLADDGTSIGAVDREWDARMPFGVAGLDERLGGGLPLGALHEFRCEETRATGALTGFATGILARIGAVRRRPILWIEEEMALAEAGLPFGPGFARFGLDPAKLLIVRARRPEEALWAFEEGLRCTGLAAVLAVIRGSPKALDLTASRRLALRAASVGVAGLLLRQAGAAEPGAAMTRWRIAPLPAGTMDGFTEGVGRPAFRAELEKNRLGPVGSFDLEWHHDRGSFAPAAAANPVARPAVSVDRPADAPAVREVVAFRKAG